MELEFGITQSFSDDLDRLTLEQRNNVKNQINIVSGSLLQDKMAFKENSSIPYIFNLKGDLDSSLYLIKADQDNRIVAAVDEDPIFDKIHFTLFRLVDKINADQVYREVGEEIYIRLGILS